MSSCEEYNHLFEFWEKLKARFGDENPICNEYIELCWKYNFEEQNFFISQVCHILKNYPDLICEFKSIYSFGETNVCCTSEANEILSLQMEEKTVTENLDFSKSFNLLGNLEVKPSTSNLPEATALTCLDNIASLGETNVPCSAEPNGILSSSMEEKVVTENSDFSKSYNLLGNLEVKPSTSNLPEATAPACLDNTEPAQRPLVCFLKKVIFKFGFKNEIFEKFAALMKRKEENMNFSTLIEKSNDIFINYPDFRTEFSFIISSMEKNLSQSNNKSWDNYSILAVIEETKSEINSSEKSLQRNKSLMDSCFTKPGNSHQCTSTKIYNTFWGTSASLKTDVDTYNDLIRKTSLLFDLFFMTVDNIQKLLPMKPHVKMTFNTMFRHIQNEWVNKREEMQRKLAVDGTSKSAACLEVSELVKLHNSSLLLFYKELQEEDQDL